jgi:hypothetical protein
VEPLVFYNDRLNGQVVDMSSPPALGGHVAFLADSKLFTFGGRAHKPNGKRAPWMTIGRSCRRIVKTVDDDVLITTIMPVGSVSMTGHAGRFPLSLSWPVLFHFLMPAPSPAFHPYASHLAKSADFGEATSQVTVLTAWQLSPEARTCHQLRGVIGQGPAIDAPLLARPATLDTVPFHVGRSRPQFKSVLSSRRHALLASSP